MTCQKGVVRSKMNLDLINSLHSPVPHLPHKESDSRRARRWGDLHAAQVEGSCLLTDLALDLVMINSHGSQKDVFTSGRFILHTVQCRQVPITHGWVTHGRVARPAPTFSTWLLISTRVVSAKGPWAVSGHSARRTLPSCSDAFSAEPYSWSINAVRD